MKNKDLGSTTQNPALISGIEDLQMFLCDPKKLQYRATSRGESLIGEEPVGMCNESNIVKKDRRNKAGRDLISSRAELQSLVAIELRNPGSLAQK